ncbi:MAG: hypothetical protein V4456_01295 [Bacteroidota bacterium]
MMANLYDHELIQELKKCATACEHCAAENLKHNATGLTERSTRLALECVSVCRAMAEELTLDDIYAIHLRPVCMFICRSCGEEFERLAGIGSYCGKVSEACNECAETCQQMATKLKASGQECL